MGNETSNLPSYGCSDAYGNLSKDSITPEYWDAETLGSTHRDLGIVTASVMLVFLLVGLPSNTAIILTILLRRLYKQPTESLLLSLAVSDFLMCIFVIFPIIIAGFAGGFIFGESDYMRCKVCQVGVMLVGLSDFSLHILALISIDRFVYIKLPLRYHRIMTMKVIILSLVLVSLLSILLSALPLIGFGDVYYYHQIATCSIQFENETPLGKNIHYMVLIIAETFIPLSILVITNLWVLCIAQKNIRNIYNVRKNISNPEEYEFNKVIKSKLRQEKHQKQIQVMRVFGGIFIANMLTWLPTVL